MPLRIKPQSYWQGFTVICEDVHFIAKKNHLFSNIEIYAIKKGHDFSNKLVQA